MTVLFQIPNPLSHPTFARFEVWTLREGKNFKAAQNNLLNTTRWDKAFRHDTLPGGSNSFIIPDKENRKFYLFSNQDAVDACNYLYDNGFWKGVNRLPGTIEELLVDYDAKGTFYKMFYTLQMLLRRRPRFVLKSIQPHIDNILSTHQAVGYMKKGKGRQLRERPGGLSDWISHVEVYKEVIPAP